MASSGYDSGTKTPAGGKIQRLHTRKKSTRKETAGLSTVFLGLAMRIRQDYLEYGVVIHDGQGVVGTERDVWGGEIEENKLLDALIERAKEYCAARGHTISLYAVATPLDSPLALPPKGFEVDRNAPPSFLARVWLELDAIPVRVHCRDTQFSLLGEAVRAVETALEYLAPTTLSIIKAATSQSRRQVLVDADYKVHLYDLHQQAALTSPGLWDIFTALACPLRKHKVRVSFFSATPRGGGVALMRHSLMRIWHLMDLDIKWYVPLGDSAVFDITKRKFHNVLQGVAPPDARLHGHEKELFERWTEWNYNKYWKADSKGDNGDTDGPSPIEADVVVIDDPQLTALIPIIRRDSPKTKIIYRSHIEIRSDLIDGGKKPQADVFTYLFGFIKQADLFISHPVKEFVPKVVKESMPVVYMPPSTDPLDGLNKPIPKEGLEVYRHYFDTLMRHSTGQRLDWGRGYIIQVARFDPSKGIPDLVEGYRLFREEISKRGIGDRSPQLILIGHISVDDPDATTILHDLQETLSTEPFQVIRDDIFALRAPPDDRLLDALMRGADLACQVSTREGFEIKVTEAIHKTRWIIATKAGGIPLQIRDGVDGKLVPPGKPKAIAEAMIDFYTSGKDKCKTGESRGNYTDRPLGGRWTDEGEGPREELFSIGNATMWQYLWNYLLGFNQEQLADIPENHRRRLECLKLGHGKRKLAEIHEEMVWDMLAIDEDRRDVEECV